jgi:hypothetical protein
MNTTEQRSTELLGALLTKLTRDYADDLWDSTTRQLLDEINAHLGRSAIAWTLNDDANAPSAASQISCHS